MPPIIGPGSGSIQPSFEQPLVGKTAEHTQPPSSGHVDVAAYWNELLRPEALNRLLKEG